jgi:hypothetical protein
MCTRTHVQVGPPLLSYIVIYIYQSDQYYSGHERQRQRKGSGNCEGTVVFQVKVENTAATISIQSIILCSECSG